MSSIAKSFMSDKIFLDTNILVYAFGTNKSLIQDPRWAAAEQIVMQGCVVSVQVMNEFVQVCRRKAKQDWQQIDVSLQIIKALCVGIVPLTIDAHEAAVAVAKRYGLNFYDSLILAAAAQAGCTTVYSEDMQHGQVVDGVQIQNPFLLPTTS
jgi:predicted nucleic acid-binding protein